MAGSRRRDQQVSREVAELRTREPHVGAWYGKSTAYSVYVLLVSTRFCYMLLGAPG